VTDTTAASPARTASGLRLVPALLRVAITALTPILLVLGSARLVMSPLFLQIEYNRPGFPEDYYGFTREDRLRYAPFAVDYLLNGEGISYLGDLTFPDGRPLYNERELRHMVDVKVVTQYAFSFALLAGILIGVASVFLWNALATRRDLARALRDGALLTWGLVATIIVLAVTSWDFFFTAFHNLFFADGTWQFLYSDTLIRLFPEQFWFDAALVIGTLTIFGAGVLFVLGNRLLRRTIQVAS
jgi:integral membrane protein (TIGR01906 family)